MFSFIETRLFTRLVLEYLSDDEYGAYSKRWWGIPNLGRSFLDRVASGNCAGPLLGAGSAVGTASSTT